MRFETLTIHAGQEPDPNNGAVMTPIYQTSTFAQDGVGKARQGYEYARTKNPTRLALENCVAELEGGQFGIAFSSGLAATDTVLRLMNSGAHVLAGNDVYGGTFRLFDKVLRRFGLDFDFVDTTDPETVAEALKPTTRMVWLETPTNPLLSITDIHAVAEIVHAHPNHPLLVVDNTFATPYNQRPLELGADIVVHSMTKYLGGHSDVVAGIAIVKDKSLYEQLAFLQNAVGAVPGPMDCFLVLRGTQDTAYPYGASCRERNRPCRLLIPASESSKSTISVSSKPSASPYRKTTNAKRKWDDLHYYERWTRCGGTLCRSDQGFHASRIIRRSEIANRSSRGDDSSFDSGFANCSGSGIGQAIGWDRT